MREDGVRASTKENEVLLTRRQTKFLYFVDVVSKDSKLFQVIWKTLNILCHLINTNLHKSDSGMVPVLPVKRVNLQYLLLVSSSF